MASQGAAGTARAAIAYVTTADISTAADELEAVALARLSALRRIHESEAVAQAALAGATASRHRLRLLSRLAALAAAMAAMEAEVRGERDEAVRLADIAARLGAIRRAA